jgi:hypothetical protein
MEASKDFPVYFSNALLLNATPLLTWQHRNIAPLATAVNCRMVDEYCPTVCRCLSNNLKRSATPPSSFAQHWASRIFESGWWGGGVVSGWRDKTCMLCSVVLINHPGAPTTCACFSILFSIPACEPYFYQTNEKPFFCSKCWVNWSPFDFNLLTDTRYHYSDMQTWLIEAH